MASSSRNQARWFDRLCYGALVITGIEKEMLFESSDCEDVFHNCGHIFRQAAIDSCRVSPNTSLLTAERMAEESLPTFTAVGNYRMPWSM